MTILGSGRDGSALGGAVPSPRERSLAAYLVVPRPGDSVKALLIPVAYVVGVLSIGEFSPESLARAAIVLVAVELLIYPARYQWNDIRGFAADQRHPSCRDRGRLPGPITEARRNVIASSLVAVVRLILVGVLVLVLPGMALGGVLGSAIVGVFGVAVVYEWLRTRFTGHDERIPPPVTAGVMAIWTTVGAGYAVRGMIGLALAVDVSTRPALAAWAVLALWAYGIAFVTSRWAVEATAFAEVARDVPDVDVRFEARAEQAREHLLALVRWLPRRLPRPENGIRAWAPLRQRTSLAAPWNVAMLGSGIAAAVSGRLLCGPASPGELAAAASVGAVATLLAVTVSRARVFVVAAGAVLLLGAMVVTDAPRPAAGVLPWLLISGAYLYFSSRCLEALSGPRVTARVATAASPVVGRALLGAQTWVLLSPAQRRATASAEPEEAPAEDLVVVAARAAEAGAAVAMRWWADRTGLEVQQKEGPRDLVSRADRETEITIRDTLKRLRPFDGVLGEEHGTIDGTSGIRWVIDPIDGTTSFLYGRADWAVSVAAVRCSDDVVMAAAVVEPVLGRTTSAQRGRGTHVDGRRMAVNEVRSLDYALIEVNFGRDEQRHVAGPMVHELATRVRDLRRGGSAAAALAHVATGRADAVWAPGLKCWDCAAGILLVEEAGGIVGDLAGTSGGSWPTSGDVLAAEPALWAALRGILVPVYAIRV